jgi:hypothetical protein
MGEAGETDDENRLCADPAHAVRGVYVEHVELLFGLINDRLAPVFEANRYFEEHTGIANKAGANNLTEALSHIGTLVEYAHAMDSNEQREQVAFFGDHLRRSMMESFEQVVKARLGKIKDEGLLDRFNGRGGPVASKGQAADCTYRGVRASARSRNGQPSRRRSQAQAREQMERLGRGSKELCRRLRDIEQAG